MEPPDPVFSFRGDMENVLCILLSEISENLLFAGTSQGYVHVWDLMIKRELRKIRVSDSSCSTLVETPLGFATLEKGEALRLWSSEWTLLKTIPVGYCGFCNIVSCGALLVPASDGKILLTNYEGELQSVMKLESDKKFGELMCMKYSSGLDFVVSCYESGLVVVWRKDGTQICDFEVQDTPICLSLDDINSSILVGTSGRFLNKLLLKGNSVTLLSKTEITNPGISDLSIRSDGKLCVASCWDNKVRYFSLKTLKLLAVLDNRSTPNCIEFSRSVIEPGLVFVGSSDGRIIIWNLYSNK